MSRKKSKSEIITFKVDPALLKALEGIPNRSSFIRAAVLAALDSVCPLCMGTGILSPGQKGHWESFAENHRITECSRCHERHLVCDQGSGHADIHRTRSGGAKADG
jgi:hypothetical protein